MPTAYAAPEHIHTRYREELFAITGHMPDVEGELTPECRAALAVALDEAGSEIDMALRGRYRLPLETVPPVITRIAVDIAVAALPRNGAEHADLIERRAADARKLLAAIAKGDMLLDLPSASETSGGGVAFHFPESPMSAKLKDYV